MSFGLQTGLIVHHPFPVQRSTLSSRPESQILVNKIQSHLIRLHTVLSALLGQRREFEISHKIQIFLDHVPTGSDRVFS